MPYVVLEYSDDDPSSARVLGKSGDFIADDGSVFSVAVFELKAVALATAFEAFNLRPGCHICALGRLVAAHS